MQGDFDSFLAHATRVQATALCPEVRLHLAGDLDELWRAQENWLGRRGLPPPYWGMAWPGGQAIARHLLDHRARIEGRSVLDLGSGSGLAAIAAAMMGASHVVANDIDPFACEAMAANARLAGIELETSADDLIGTTGRWDIVLAGDLWYERFLAARLMPWLRGLAAGGAMVLVGDLGRAYFPRAGLVEIGRYDVDTGSCERGKLTTTPLFCIPPHPN